MVSLAGRVRGGTSRDIDQISRPSVVGVGVFTARCLCVSLPIEARPAGSAMSLVDAVGVAITQLRRISTDRGMAQNKSFWLAGA
jgi:hypothetical protein